MKSSKCCEGMTPECIPSKTAGSISVGTACSCSLRLDKLVSSSALLEGVPAALVAAFNNSTAFFMASLHTPSVSSFTLECASHVVMSSNAHDMLAGQGS